MMETFEAIAQRRAVKQYDPDHELTDDEIGKLMKAALLSPTSFNIQHWRFVLVQEKELRKQIQVAAWGQAQVTDASLLIILTADVQSWAKSPERYWKNAPKEVSEMMVNMMGSFYEGKEQLQRDEAMRSCGLAGQTIMLAAKAMGYDSCPMIGFDPVQVADAINLPEDHIISFMIVVGKAIEPARSRGGQLSLEDVMIINKYD